MLERLKKSMIASEIVSNTFKFNDFIQLNVTLRSFYRNFDKIFQE